MKIKYVTIQLNTTAAYDKADRLKNNGWKIVSSGLFYVTLASK